MSQNAVSSAFFYKGIFKAIRKLHISLLVVEKNLDEKILKLKKINMKTITNRSKKIVEKDLQICQYGLSWITLLHS